MSDDEAGPAKEYLDTKIQQLRSDKAKHPNCTHNEAVLMSILFSNKLESVLSDAQSASQIAVRETSALASVFQVRTTLVM